MRAHNRVLIHSNAPQASTGYGVQTKHLVSMLAADGYQVAVSCTWGHQARISDTVTPDGHPVRLYPQGYENNSPDVLVGHAEHWFEGDPDAGIIILLCDAWTLLKPELCATLREFRVVAWTPVDHYPVPPMVRTFLEQSAAIPVAMSKYGHTQLVKAGLDAAYVPLSVDTDAYKPTLGYENNGELIDPRIGFGIPTGAFVVGMVAMNKDPHDRKGFGEALAGFAQFQRTHPEAVLFIHTEPFGVLGGFDIPKIAANLGIPPHALIFPNGYAYRHGFPPPQMAALYTTFDVLLAPSRGEGFCVPLIEAQACGTPVIASDYTAQTELTTEDSVLVDGQLQWNSTQSAFYKTASVSDIVDALNLMHTELQEDAEDRAVRLREFASDYDYRTVYANHWKPVLDSFETPPEVEKPVMETVDVIVPLMRPNLLEKLAESVNDRRANLVVVYDEKHPPNLTAMPLWRAVPTCEAHTTYAEKVNLGVFESDADWVLVVGDDVEFTDGWFDAAAEQTRFGDVVGTNDSEPGRVRNPHVAAGRHADHFFIRRSYIEDEGASLDGPGQAMPLAYTHWYVDKEVIGLAKARGVYRHADECRIIHHHPGYDGDEKAREADPVYMAALAASEADNATWASRAPLIEQHRVIR